jgi:hypothetical protein
MSSNITYDGLLGTIPSLGDSSNIVTAFDNYHNSISTRVAVLATANTFTGTQVINPSSAGYLEVTTSSGNGVRLVVSDNDAYPFIIRPIRSGTAQSSSELYYNYTSNRWISEVPLQSSLITAAGTTTVAPITITSGTNLTSPAAGSIESDGKAFYGTPSSVSVNRGLIPTSHYYTWYDSNTSINPLTSNFGYPVFSMAANTTYEVECVYFMVLNTGLVSTSIIADWTGTAAPLTNYYEVSSGFSTSSFAGSTATQSTSYQTQSGTTTISATASTARYGVVKVKAIVRVATGNAGTLGFAVYGSSSSATITMYPGSYIKATPLGSDTVSTIGTWT